MMPFNFLLCSERSGSHLITRLLNAHSQVCGPATTHLFRILACNVTGYGDLASDLNWQTLRTDAIDLLHATLGKWQTTPTVASLDRECPERTLASLLRTIYESEARAHGKPQLFIKEIEVFRFWSFLRTAFPASRYIYLVRDPRDMALSWKKSAAIRGGVVRAARVWWRDQSSFEPIVRELAAEGRVTTLTYEQLIQDPKGALQRVTELLEVSFEPSQLDFHRDNDTECLANAAADFRNLQRPIMSHNLGKYRSELSRREVEFIEAQCGPLMDVFGYAREYEVPGDLTALASQLEPLEPYTKEAYDKVSVSERQVRQAWVEVTQRISARVGS